jgi:hypothetical protein
LRASAALPRRAEMRALACANRKSQKIASRRGDVGFLQSRVVCRDTIARARPPHRRHSGNRSSRDRNKRLASPAFRHWRNRPRIRIRWPRVKCKGFQKILEGYVRQKLWPLLASKPTRIQAAETAKSNLMRVSEAAATSVRRFARGMKEGRASGLPDEALLNIAGNTIGREP